MSVGCDPQDSNYLKIRNRQMLRIPLGVDSARAPILKTFDVKVMPQKSKTSSMDFNEGECMQTGDASGLSQITDHLLLTL